MSAAVKPCRPSPNSIVKVQQAPAGAQELELFGDDHPLRQRFNLAAGEAAMPSEGHDVAQFSLPCPPADGFGGDVKQGGRFSGSQVAPGPARSEFLRRVGNATQLRHLQFSHGWPIG